MRRLLAEALKKTEADWPVIRRAYRYLHCAARILENPRGLTGGKVRRRYRGLLRAMHRAARKHPELRELFAHFQKVSDSYWPGLFHCYRIAGLPRTNNDLEQFFGSHRHHERRATGRKAASPGTLLRGSTRVVARAITRVTEVTAADLELHDAHRWRSLRAQVEQRHHSQVLRSRFRRNPEAYLTGLETQFLKSVLLV